MSSRPNLAERLRQRREARLAAEAANAKATQAAELARLDKLVENSSEKNRNFFIAYLGLLIYVQAIVFSTTDLQLLVSADGLKMPLIDLTLPLERFYILAPIFVIALHFNFMQNLESHHYKFSRIWRSVSCILWSVSCICSAFYWIKRSVSWIRRSVSRNRLRISSFVRAMMDSRVWRRL